MPKRQYKSWIDEDVDKGLLKYVGTGSAIRVTGETAHGRIFKNHKGQMLLEFPNPDYPEAAALLHLNGYVLESLRMDA